MYQSGIDESEPDKQQLFVLHTTIKKVDRLTLKHDF